MRADAALLEQEADDGLVALRGPQVQCRPSIVVRQRHVHSEQRVPADIEMKPIKTLIA